LYLSNAFDINVTQLNNNYQINQSIPLQFKITNTFDIINATLRLNYDVPTIVGHYQTYVDKNITLNLGNNIIDTTIPHDYPTSNLVITPELILNYDTSKLNGLTYYWNDGVAVRQMTTKYPQIQLADIIFTNNSFTLSITNTSTSIVYQNQIINQTINLSCLNGLSCPSGYTCNNNGNCIQTIYINNGTNNTVYINNGTNQTIYVPVNVTAPQLECWVAKSYTQQLLSTDACVNVSANACILPLYPDSASCEAANAQASVTVSFWSKYGWAIGLLAGVLSIISSIVYFYFAFHKKKR
jgi:hypothetical protein